MNNRSWLMLLVVLVVAIGGYLVYDNQQDDIEIDFPDIEINDQ
ncbi:MAG: hypothetical protein WEB90_07740 [Gemmatimonadota bacterium]